MTPALQFRRRAADVYLVSTLTIPTPEGPVTIEMDGDVLTVATTSGVRVERLVADSVGWRDLFRVCAEDAQAGGALATGGG